MQFVATATMQEAEQRLDAIDPVKAGDFIGLWISPTFFTGDTTRPGFLDRLTPIRLWGEKSVSGKIVEFESFLVGARLQLGRVDQTEVFEVSFILKESYAWLKSKPTARVKIPTIGIEGIISLPKASVDQNQLKVGMSFLQLRLSIKTKIGDIALCVKQAPIEKVIRFGSIAEQVPSVTVYPTCLDVGSEEIKAFHACADGQTEGRLSAERPELNIKLEMDVSSIHTGLDSNGGYYLSIPLKPRSGDASLDTPE